jgi:hypothetical protein
LADIIEVCEPYVLRHWHPRLLAEGARNVAPKRGTRKALRSASLRENGRQNLQALGVLCYFGQFFERVREELDVRAEDTASELIRLALSRWGNPSARDLELTTYLSTEIYRAIFLHVDAGERMRAWGLFVRATWGIAEYTELSTLAGIVLTSNAIAFSRMIAKLCGLMTVVGGRPANYHPPETERP